MELLINLFSKFDLKRHNQIITSMTQKKNWKQKSDLVIASYGAVLLCRYDGELNFRGKYATLQ